MFVSFDELMLRLVKEVRFDISRLSHAFKLNLAIRDRLVNKPFTTTDDILNRLARLEG